MLEVVRQEMLRRELESFRPRVEADPQPMLVSENGMVSESGR